MYSGCSIAARISEAMVSASALLVSLTARPFSTRWATDVRLQRRLARVAQRTDLAPVAEVVAELDDLRDAAEVLGEADGASERLPGQVVDRDLAVVEDGVGDVLQVLVDQLLDDRDVLSHRRRADLLVVSHHHHALRHVERDQRHHVAPGSPRR